MALMRTEALFLALLFAVGPTASALRDLGRAEAREAAIGAAKSERSDSASVEAAAVSAGGECAVGANDLPPGVVCRAVPDPRLKVPPFDSPYTAPDIPWNYHQQAPGGTQPEQVSLSPATRNGSFLFVRFIVPGSPNASAVESPAVSYGTNPSALTSTGKSQGASFYTYGPYTSGAIHISLLGPLLPSTKYYYQVQGLPTVFSFSSMPAPGDSTIHIALVGDVGQTLNSSETLRNVLRCPSSLVLFAGDLTYADHYGPPCSLPPKDSSVLVSSDVRPADAELATGHVCGMGGLRWDSWGRLAQDTFAYKVAAYVPGNHELEYTPSWGEMTPYKAYRARIPKMVDDASWAHEGEKIGAHLPFGGVPALSPLFYSLEAGPVHVIGISSYSPFLVYSHQWYWLQDDLCSIDRARTPWVVVVMHVPLYNTNIGHYLEGEPMRLEFEDFLHEAGVDLVVSGHVHAYERSFPVHRMRQPEDGCGAVHITVGDGGNIEKVAGPFVEPQPSYSAYREESFGHAELVVEGPKKATYTWYRNQDGEAVVGDRFVLESRSSKCKLTTPSFCKGW